MRCEEKEEEFPMRSQEELFFPVNLLDGQRLNENVGIFDPFD